MAIELKLPELGENVETADVVGILVAKGDAVTIDQPVLELETNKATVELPADVEGVVVDILVSLGEEVSVGQALLLLDAQGGIAAPEKEDVVPADADKKETDAGEPPAVESEPPAIKDAIPAVEKAEDTPEGKDTTLAAPAAPSVRKFAREIGIDIADVKGTGSHGRVSIEDVKTYAKDLNSGRHKARTSAPAQATLPDFSKWGSVRHERMSNIRKSTAEHLATCWREIAHMTQFDTADITQLEGLRKKYAPRAEATGGKLTMAVMVVRIVASALKMFPKFNASIDMQNRQVIFKEYVNIGIAVSTERGLLVPVLRDVDKKNMVEIAAEVSELARRTRDGKAALADLQGGTFTVTNLGSIGGTHFTPIVNHPEVAILGMGRAYTRAGFEDGKCVPRTILPLSLSYDHRLIDGAEGIRFMRWVAEAIEEPLLLSLEGK